MMISAFLFQNATNISILEYIKCHCSPENEKGLGVARTQMDTALARSLAFVLCPGC